MSPQIENGDGRAGAMRVAASTSQAAGAPRVSVVIPTFRRPDLLSRCLEAVCAQSLAPSAYEVIVADDGHDDATRTLVEGFDARGGPAVRYVRPQNGRGPASARNAGWRAAQAELIAFTDDDTVPAADWLAAGERDLDPAWAALCGRVVVPRRTGRDGAERRPTDHELMTRGLEAAEFVTANAFVRRSALLAIGGFDERFLRAWREDSDLQFRLQRDAGPVGRSADAVVEHPVRPERWGVSLRQQKNVFFDALLYKKHPRLYRERILAAPPWDYYAIVALAGAALPLGLANARRAASISLGLAAVGVAALALRRLRPTTRDPAHVLEMLATSACIPFLSVYWRLRGARHFRVLYW